MNFKKEFPLIDKIVFLDSAAGSLKPISVINAISEFYRDYPFNPHSHDTPGGQKVIEIYKSTIKKIKELIDAQEDQVLLTASATDSLNRSARLLEKIIKKDDEILISKFNHNANVIPWIELAKRKQAKIIISDNIEKDINIKTKIICFSQANNAYGKNVNYKKIYKMAQSTGAYVVNDSAQAIVHEKVSMKYADIIAFSANKIYGPTGIGVLAIKNKLFKYFSPDIYGGGATANVNQDGTYDLKSSIEAFNPGTPNSAGIVGLNEALSFFDKAKLYDHKIKELLEHLKLKLKTIDDLVIHYSYPSGMVVFNIKNIPSQDIVSKLAYKYNIYTRSGAFCNHLGMKEPDGSIRVSLGIYNTKQDINKLIKALMEGDFLELI